MSNDINTLTTALESFNQIASRRRYFMKEIAALEHLDKIAFCIRAEDYEKLCDLDDDENEEEIYEHVSLYEVLAGEIAGCYIHFNESDVAYDELKYYDANDIIAEVEKLLKSNDNG